MIKKIIPIIFILLIQSVHFVYSHCDTMDGPVIKDAQNALETGDVTPILKWVKKDAEPEVRSAFQEATANRAKDPHNNEVTDRKFFETLIRIHRTGEGETFTGLKPAGSVEPMIAKADEALEKGFSVELVSTIAHHLTEGLNERFARAVETKKHRDESVEAGREYVEAYVQYIHYVEGIHHAIAGKGRHHE